MYRTPTEELKIASACLDIAKDNFTVAKNHLEPIEGHQLTHNFLHQFRSRIAKLQGCLTELEQRVQDLTLSSRSGQQDS